MSGQVEDVLNRFEETMEKIDGMEKAFETKLDNKFNELLARFPPPAAPVAPLQQQQQQRLLPNQVGRAQRVPLEPGQTSGAGVPTVDASVASPTTAEVEDHYEGEVDQNQQQQQQHHFPNQVGRAQPFPLTLGKILVPLLMLLPLLLLLQRWRTITRMRLIKIRTTCNHQHHHHQVILMNIIATVGLHHHLRYEIMTIFLNWNRIFHHLRIDMFLIYILLGS